MPTTNIGTRRQPSYKFGGNYPMAYGGKMGAPRGYADLIGSGTPAPARTRPSYSSYFNGDGRVNIPNVTNELDYQFNAANDANDQRYNQSLDLATRSRDESLGYLDTYGETAKDDINRGLNRQIGGNKQSAIDRGIYNFSTLDDTNRLDRESASRASAAVDERANLLRSDVSRQGYNDIMGVLSSRVDQGPNVDSYLNLINREAAMRAEESKRNQDQANLQKQTQANNASIPTAIVNGVPQYGNQPNMPPLAGGNQGGGMYPGLNSMRISSTSMGGGPALAPLMAGMSYNPQPNAPVGAEAQYQSRQNQGYQNAMTAQNPQQQAPQQGASPYSQQNQGYRNQRLFRQLPNTGIADIWKKYGFK